MSSSNSSKPLPDQSLLLALLRYDSETGTLYWRDRPVEMFEPTPKFSAETRCRQWNSRCAGKEAFSTPRKGYLHGHILNEKFSAHRIIWKLVTGEEPEHIDHINGDRADNRFANLRSVTEGQNSQNRSLSPLNVAGYPGVTYREDSCNWRAKITWEGRVLSLGTFATKEAAIAARKQAEARYNFHPNHGRRARRKEA